MEAIKNKQQFAEIEYCFEQYFNKRFAPIVRDEVARVRRNAERETQQRDSSDGWYGDALSPFTTTRHASTSGVWNRKTAEDLSKSCTKKFFSDPKVQNDMALMVSCLKATIKGEIGEKRYAELSKNVPDGDLATHYFKNRYNTLFMEQLARQKVPKKSFIYIMREGFLDSIPGILYDNQKPSSAMDEKIRDLSAEFYGASAIEKGAAYATSFVLDAASTGGLNSAKKAAAWLAGDAALRPAFNALHQWVSDPDPDIEFGKNLWGSETAVSRIRTASKKIDPQSSSRVSALNDYLNYKVYQPSFNEKSSKEIANSLRTALQKTFPTGEDVSKGIVGALKSVGLKASDKSSFPSWMSSKSKKELFTMATSYTAMAIEAKTKGIKHLKVGNKTFTVAQLAQQGYDYSRALEANVAQSKNYMATAFDAAAETQTDVRQTSYADQPSSTEGGAAGEEQQSKQKQSQDVAGWESILKQFGLGGFGTVGRNLGYVLAMLPDIIIGMFTGKSRNLKLGDNLLPIGAIIFGMFVKNPLLKLLLIGFGGANLLNKAGHEAIENRDAEKSTVRQYRKYPDEPLDPRITQPVLKGNTLVAKMDNIPMVISINSEAVDAYEKGVLPLNTLSNAVLRKYDEQKTSVIDRYEQEVSQDQAVERSRGLK